MNTRYGLGTPRILLPAPGTEWEKWSVVACDQYSAQKEYWDQVEKIVGDAPSALRLMLPEAWLDRSDREKAVAPAMRRYLSEGVLRQTQPGMIWVCRETTTGMRRGLVAMLDLEAYDFSPDSKSLIRATEATVASRLPARVRLRREAALEMPHVMVLVDDPGMEIANLMKETEKGRPVYDFSLMMNGGHISGWKVGDKEEKAIAGLLQKWAESQGEDPMLFAVGDGNHSLAAAKVFWDEIKTDISPEQRENHPARFALAEIVNLRDPALAFEPIHRLLMHVDAEYVFTAVERELRNLGVLGKDPRSSHVLPWIWHNGEKELLIDKDAAPLPLVVLQPVLDRIIPPSDQEYIHGEEALRGLADREGNAGILLPALDKGNLFSVVRSGGPLPRKCFSMGEAQDKRFYLECRLLNWDKEVLQWES